MRSILRVASVAGLGLVIGGWSGSASATPVKGGVTQTVLENGKAATLLSPAGVSVSLLGTAVSSGSDIGLPVTGGDVDLAALEGEILHAGSGVALAKGGNIVRLADFRIDLTNLLVIATVSGIAGGFVLDPAPIQLFDLTVCNFSGATDPCVTDHDSIRLDGYGARLTSNTATLLGSALGLDAATTAALDDRHLAIARLDIALVPEPGTGLLVATGVLGLAASRRRRANQRNFAPV
jgi:hypothetical protein